MNMFSKTISLATVILLFALVGCSGNASPNTPNNPNASFTLGGTVSGLVGSGLLLEDRENFNDLELTGDGPFTFNAEYAANTSYDVVVKTQPTNPIQSCSVADGKGTITANVSKVVVTCEAQVQAPGLDPNFGAGGRTDPVGSFTPSDFAGARLNENGSLDSSFGDDGSFTVDFFDSSDEASSVVIQPDGKIVIGGFVLNGSSFGTGLARIIP